MGPSSPWCTGKLGFHFVTHARSLPAIKTTILAPSPWLCSTSSTLLGSTGALPRGSFADGQAGGPALGLKLSAISFRSGFPGIGSQQSIILLHAGVPWFLRRQLYLVHTLHLVNDKKLPFHDRPIIWHQYITAPIRQGALIGDPTRISHD
ncbi:hypothetical protein ASPZODRAFT_1933593 [Penicilliopsis zonata CBS 506.65]|uniref:Uncharacterized protein n=1 Tax=Penicilliopsis zonata CBS 506.65 TaxID=1073090 RepID=A0A1L9SJ77_9EURO|nr:hypothetical protein ASPZODRAFT_1933593 [Penicilliopsis zonata CBS 506.65]OJJ47270.1 hypothetical protein ASPZODRAFT_1933593 [Penicilliopsis zonata CBS 506.65]